MDNEKIVSIISYKRRIFGTIDGNIPKMKNLAGKNIWIPASAGMLGVALTDYIQLFA